ncbi:MAG TPA: GAF domain-containing protein [Candidatus Limnocylindrales bacterium]|nr:GAF domain-containing protein [Candidatus Limnocylindrales bacterium]
MDSEPVIETVDLNRLLILIMNKITKSIEAQRSTLFLYDEEKQELWSKIAQDSEIKEIRLKLGEGIAGFVMATGETLNITDAYKDPRFNRAFDEQTGYLTQTIFCKPLVNTYGQRIGVIEVLNKKGGAFTERDEKLLDALCSQAAIAIENAQLYQHIRAKNRALVEAKRQLEQKIRELDILYEIEKEISSSWDLDKLLDKILFKTTQTLHAEAGSIFLLEEKTNLLYFKSITGEKAEELRKFKIKMGEGIVGWVASTKTPVIVNNVAEDPRFAGHISAKIQFPTRSIICVPLVENNRILGALELINKKGEDNVFTEDDLKLLEVIGSQVARAIETHRLREKEAKEERLAMVGQMVSGIIHDLKNPISSIIGFVELISLDKTTEENRKKFCKIILREIESLTNMTREILNFAKGETNLLLRRYYLSAIVNDVLDLMRPDFESRNIQLKVDLKYRSHVYVDESKMKRVFYNIIRNAIEAMPQGGVFNVKSYLTDSHVVVELSDTGCGIPEEIRDRLFDSFVTQGKEQGTGLGLAMVKKIIDEHKGEIEVESEVGRGTTFRIKLNRI